MCNQIAALPETTSWGGKEQDLQSAAAASQPQRFKTVVQRLSVHSSAVDNCGWDALMIATQRGDASAYRRLLSEAAIWLRRHFARRLPGAMGGDGGQGNAVAIPRKRQTYDPTP